jgi:DNA primase
MREWVVKESQDIEKILSEVSSAETPVKPVQFGRERLTATPGISKAKELIVVEGRADVINLIKSGYQGVIALEGVKIPKTIINLANKKGFTAFLDGDRGGDLILKELMQVAKPLYVARAPRGKEVEELTPEEIREALSNKLSMQDVEMENEISKIAKELKGTLEAILLKKNGSQIGRVPVSELVEKLKSEEEVDLVVFDGIVTGRLIDKAKEKKIRTLVGERLSEGAKIPSEIQVKIFKEFT